MIIEPNPDSATKVYLQITSGRQNTVLIINITFIKQTVKLSDFAVENFQISNQRKKWNQAIRSQRHKQTSLEVE